MIRFQGFHVLTKLFKVIRTVWRLLVWFFVHVEWWCLKKKGWSFTSCNCESCLFWDQCKHLLGTVETYVFMSYYALITVEFLELTVFKWRKVNFFMVRSLFVVIWAMWQHHLTLKVTYFMTSMSDHHMAVASLSVLKYNLIMF